MKKKNIINKNDFDGHLVFKNSKKFNNLSGRLEHNKQLANVTKFFQKKILLKKNQLKRNFKMICLNKSKKCFDRSKKIFKKNGFDYYKCGCEVIYVNPVLRNQIFHSNLYNENSYTEVMKSKANFRLDTLRFKYGLQLIKTKLKKKRVLDIGCGFGFFLDEARKQGWDVYGSEINKECIKILNKKNISCINFDEENSIKFDLITLWTVFEHIINPNNFFAKVSRMLKKNGKILINIPNVNSLSARIMHSECSMFHGHQHLNFYSPKTLTKFLRINGFKIKILETVISDIDTVRNHMSFQLPYLGESKEKFYFLESELMHKNMMGYTILAIAQKL